MSEKTPISAMSPQEFRIRQFGSRVMRTNSRSRHRILLYRFLRTNGGTNSGTNCRANSRSRVFLQPVTVEADGLLQLVKHPLGEEQIVGAGRAVAALCPDLRAVHTAVQPAAGGVAWVRVRYAVQDGVALVLNRGHVACVSAGRAPRPPPCVPRKSQINMPGWVFLYELACWFGVLGTHPPRCPARSSWKILFRCTCCGDVAETTSPWLKQVTLCPFPRNPTLPTHHPHHQTPPPHPPPPHRPLPFAAPP